jgi:hypothetical protein
VGNVTRAADRQRAKYVRGREETDRLSRDWQLMLHQPRTALGAVGQYSTQSQFIEHTGPKHGTLRVNILSKDVTH